MRSNYRLVNFLSKDDSIRSLLHWVVSGLDELDEESRKAEQACLVQARHDEQRYPTFHTSSETSSDSVPVPLDPVKVAEENLAEMEGKKEEEADLSAGNMGMLSSTAPQETDEDGMRRARLVLQSVSGLMLDILMSLRRF